MSILKDTEMVLDPQNLQVHQTQLSNPTRLKFNSKFAPKKWWLEDDGLSYWGFR